MNYIEDKDMLIDSLLIGSISHADIQDFSCEYLIKTFEGVLNRDVEPERIFHNFMIMKEFPHFNIEQCEKISSILLNKYHASSVIKHKSLFLILIIVIDIHPITIIHEDFEKEGDDLFLVYKNFFMYGDVSPILKEEIINLKSTKIITDNSMIKFDKCLPCRSNISIITNRLLKLIKTYPVYVKRVSIHLSFLEFREYFISICERAKTILTRRKKSQSIS